MKKSSAGSSSLSSNDNIANERLLFHGTSKTNPKTIVSHPDSFMKDYSAQGYYGKGLYFAELARYSNAGYSYIIEGTNQNQLLVCSVICGNSIEYGKGINREMSHSKLGNYHSVHGGPHNPSTAGPGENDSEIFAIYKDSQVTPRYLITYEDWN